MIKEILKKQEIGTVKKQDILENQANKVLLAIGSNLGNRKLNIEKSKFLLEFNKIKIIKTSSYYETLSWPNKSFPKYLNIVVEVETPFNPLTLFKKLQVIEAKMGRKMSPKNNPRTCDIDIIDYNNKCLTINSNSVDLQIPHPRAHLRNFVLIPLYEISKNWIHPKFKEKITYLLSKRGSISLRTIKLI